jgi:hypothetical protein
MLYLDFILIFATDVGVNFTKGWLRQINFEVTFKI